MSLYECHLEYLSRTCDEETLKTILKAYTIQIDYYDMLIQKGVAVEYLDYLIEESEGMRKITEKALKIKQSEVKSVKGN